MGRKRAPQPLSLGEHHSSGSNSPHGSGSNGPIVDNGTTVSPEAHASAVTTDPQELDSQSPRPGVAGVASAGDPSLQVASSPTTSSKSSRSPRSPFSRFNNPKKGQPQQAQAQVPSSHAHHQSHPVESTQSTCQHSPHHAQSHSADDTGHQDYYNTHQHQESQPRHAQFSFSQTNIPQSVTTPTLLREGAGQYQLTVQQPTPEREREEEKHSGSGRRFFHFNKPSRSAQQPHQHTTQKQGLGHINSNSEVMSRGTELPAMSDQVSTKASKYSDQSSGDQSNPKSPPPSLPSRSDISLASGNGEQDPSGTSRKNKPKQFTLLGRTRSQKEKESQNPKGTSPRDPKEIKMQEPERAHTVDGQQPTKNAPPVDGLERYMNSAARNQSVDRAVYVTRDIARNKEPAPDKEQHHYHNNTNRSHPSSFRDNSGSAFFSGLKNSGTRAADMISKGLFGKGGRSGSTTEKDRDREPVVDDEHYQLKVINRPLVEQTRLTRISKRLEQSRDKTEFWMPAFPWRAIDYLNYKGSDVEGLYRVPGSGPQIKKWQRRFDEEYDVDLFAQEDLYDINIIGSMLKAWLRELPDELFPKEAQDRISRECSGAEEVPQQLIDELSSLSPYNYYLLFAITCHLSLLLAHSDKNKMDFRNLCICFQPCMKIDAFCFRFLVCDWRQCWQGCKNEAKFIEEEYMLMDQPPPKVVVAGTQAQTNGNGLTNNRSETHDDRNLSSSDSSKQSAQTREPPQNDGKLRKKPLSAGQSNGSMGSNNSTVSTSLTVDSDREPPRRSGDLRPLSPIKPLSPLGF